MSPSLKLWLRDTGERALSTLVQTGAVFLPLLLGPWNVDLGKAILTTCFAPVFTVILAAVLIKIPAPTSFTLDVITRIARTFVASFGALITADGFDLFDASAWKGAIIAALLAVAVVIKAKIAQPIPGTITPASLVTPPTDS